MRAEAANPEEEATKRSRQKLLEQVGIVVLVSGVVLGMGVSSIPSLARGLQIGLLILALVFVAVGLLMIRRFRTRGSE